MQFSKLLSWKSPVRAANGSKFSMDSGLPENQDLYHMLAWPHARQIVDNGMLRLSPVWCWTDPYEKWWCDILFNRAGPLSNLQAYGLCFTTGAHDEPRWRMAAFERTDPIVRLRSSAARVFNALHSVGADRTGSGFLAAVHYQPQEWLLNYARSIAGGNEKEVTRTAAEMLMHKRAAFKFEREVRLLWLDNAPTEPAVFVGIDAALVFDQVMVSPYAKTDDREEIEAYFRTKGIAVRKSSSCKFQCSKKSGAIGSESPLSEVHRAALAAIKTSGRP